MKRSTKKGFTIVELVIVIAIIAILAAVLIPTFASLIQKANESKDTQLVRNLNTALAADNKEHKTMQDALDAAAAFGYDVGKINASATDNEILWDSVNDAFCYYNKDKGVEYLPQTELKGGEKPADYLLWKIYTSEAKVEEDVAAGKVYSIYWNSDAAYTKELKAGFDAGNSKADMTLKYVGGTGAQNVIVYTNGGTLEVNAPLDTVNHYGVAVSVKITAVADKSYHENGVVAQMEIAKGHIVIENGAVCSTVKLSDAAETGSVKVTVNNNNNVYVIGSSDKLSAESSATITKVESVDSKVLNETTGVSYKSLVEAYNASNSGNTLVLLDNQESERINLEDKDIKIKLNGKTLTGTSAYGVLLCPKNGHTVAVDGTVEGSTVYGTIMCTEKTVGNIVIDGGVYKADKYIPFYINGAASDTCKLTISNATIVGMNGGEVDGSHGLYLAGKCEVLLTNCDITGVDTGIELRAGSLTIDNCSVKGNPDTDAFSANGNGTTVLGAAIAISQHTTNYPISVTIKSGTFVGAYAIFEKDLQDSTGRDSISLEVLGGTFKGNVYSENCGKFISSGNFDTDVSAYRK